MRRSRPSARCPEVAASTTVVAENFLKQSATMTNTYGEFSKVANFWEFLPVEPVALVPEMKLT